MKFREGEQRRGGGEKRRGVLKGRREEEEGRREGEYLRGEGKRGGEKRKEFVETTRRPDNLVTSEDIGSGWIGSET